jgi:ubiquinone/menaquinone biosynthesis C-methylase UbiE
MNHRRIGSYDGIAETYDHIAVPHLFIQPAMDLVLMLKLPPGAKVIDIGTGTGIAAALVSKRSGSGTLVVALDPSLGMLRFAREKGLRCLAVGVVPYLPFQDAVLDGAIVSFVLSHLASYQKSLVEIIRVVRPGGQLAFSTWGPRQCEWRNRWQAMAESFVTKEQFDFGLREALPWEGHFSDAGNLQEALREVGLEDIEVRHREYTMKMTVDDFLLMREITFQAKLMQELLETAQWESFRQHVRNDFHRSCRDLIEDTRDAYLAVGTKPKG